MGNYHDLYLKTDILSLEFYGLDPIHYFSSSKLSWDAMFIMTGIELELISDIGIHLFIKKGMRGAFFIFLKDIVKQIINT